MNTKVKKILAGVSAAALLFGCTACGKAAAASATSAQSAAGTVSAAAVSSTDDMFTDRDYEVGYSDYTAITLSDGGVTGTGGGYNGSGSVVTITRLMPAFL